MILNILTDDCPECPMEWDGQWTLVSFDRNSIHHEEADDYFNGVKAKKPGLARKLACGTAFRLWDNGVDYTLIGKDDYRLSREGWAGVLLWEHPVKDMGATSYIDRAKDAKAFLEDYNAWRNGYVYGYILTDDDGKELDSCFGFYSPASLIENVRHHLKGAIPKIIGCTDFLSADDLAA